MKMPWLLFAFLLFLPAEARCQQGEQPPPFSVQSSNEPSAAQSSGQSPVPQQHNPQAPVNVPLPQPDRSTVDLRDVPSLSPQPPTPADTASQIRQVQDTTANPGAESPSRLNTHWYSLAGPYVAPHTPQIPGGHYDRLTASLHEGKLYLSLHDALVLAIENNLDVEISRDNLLLADTDLVRAQGGGNLRGIDYTLLLAPQGVGGATSPILNTTTSAGASPTGVNVTDLTQVTQAAIGQQQNLGENSGFAYAFGPSIPLFDPNLIAEAGFLRRSDQTALDSTSTTESTATTGPLDFVNTGIDYQQGFSPGTQLEAYVNNASQVLYGSSSSYDLFHAPSTSVTLTQPLLRGRGRSVNLRFVHIAQVNRRVSRLLFEQQLLETAYGISRLYYDLVSLGENIGVKQEALASAQKLYNDDKDQVDLGTLPPIELTRAQSLLASSRLDLIQAQGEYRQQETILREQILRKMSDPASSFLEIVPTDTIDVPGESPNLDVAALISDALTQRPDLAQAALQVKADEISVSGSKNGVHPILNVYANVQTRGAAIEPYQTLGSLGTGVPTIPTALTQGGLRLSTIYQAGVQLNLPLRNRIAQADAARDEIQLRQAESRSTKVENDIRQQIESAAIALENAHDAYGAAVESRDYQQQLLQAERDKFSVGESTNFLIIQDQAYLAQARATEVAARSDWMKARVSLDRALGDLLEKNQILVDESIANEIVH